MSTNFPTGLDTLTNPTSTDPMTSPSHSAQHANANDAIEALEAKVGIDGSAVTTSLDYKIARAYDMVVGKNVVGASGSTETLTDPDVDPYQDITLTANCTITFATVTSTTAHKFTLILRQDGTGGRTVTWPGSVVWSDGSVPVVNSSANAVTIIDFLTVDGGTTWWGFDTPDIHDEIIYGNALDVGVEAMSRGEVTTNTATAPVSGMMKLTYFTARKNFSTSNGQIVVGGTAGATLTTGKLGLYSVAANGDLTRVAITANSTGAFTSANTVSTVAWTAPFSLAKGTRYAFAVLVVGTTMPTYCSSTSAGGGWSTLIHSSAPRMAGEVSGQTDIPSSVTNASISNTPTRIWGACI